MPVKNLSLPSSRALARSAVRVSSRGAAMVEYAIILVLILIIAALSTLHLGKTTRSGMDRSTMTFSS